MSREASVREAAIHFGVVDETVRSWIRSGCPCVRPGEPGRGHGALLNLDDVGRWRASRAGQPAATPDDLLERIERAMVDVLRRDGGNGQPIHVILGIPARDAVALLTHTLKRIRRSLGGGG